MWTFLYWLAVLSVLCGLGFLAVVSVRAYVGGTTPAALLFKQRPEPRIEIIEQANMDGRRKLVLIRRDDVEHLLMTGGPVDVVIETGIGDRGRRAAESTPPPSATVFPRQPRTLGQAAAAELGKASEG